MATSPKNHGENISPIPLNPSRNLAISINRKPEEVYLFVFDIHNMPKWASSFCHAVIKWDGEQGTIQTPQGPLGLRLAAKNNLGVLDHYIQPQGGKEIYVPLRVVANGEGSEVLFTLFRTPDMTDERFAADGRMVEQDLKTLKRLMEGEPSPL